MSKGRRESAEARDVLDQPRTRSLGPREQRIWLLEQLEPGTPAQNLPVALRLVGPLDRDALQRALDGVVARHEALRTVFSAVDGSPTASVADPGDVELRASDCLGDPGGAMPLLREEAERPFDLAQPPFLRATLVAIGEEEHVLMLVTHEIACDASSAELLLDELCRLYEEAMSGAAAEDVVPYRESTPAGEHRQDTPAAAFWRQHLAGAPVLDLPTDRPRPPVQSFRGKRLQASIADVEQLDAVCAERTASRRAVLAAAFATVLHRYSGQSELVVGLEDHPQEPREGDLALGPLANALPLRVDLTGEPSFGELVRRVEDLLAEVEPHRGLPFELVVEEVDPERDLSRSPLFQVFLAYEPRPLGERVAAELRLLPEELELGSGRFDLALRVRPDSTAESLVAELDYCADLFEERTARRLLGHLQTLLSGALEEPDTPLHALPLLTADERRELLEDWNSTEAPYPERCLHELVVEQARARPDAPAVEFEGLTLTYGELVDRAGRLAAHLRSLDVGPGVLVGICCERSADMMVGLLGILGAGAAYVPIDPGYPAERQAFMLDDAQVSVLVSQARLLEQLPEHAATIVCLDRDWPTIAERPSEPPAGRHSPDQLAYVIYTSGSTGKPKGVEIRHRSVVNLLTHMRVEPGLAEDDVVVNLTTPAFDLSVPDLYLPLVYGARLVVVPAEATLDGAEIATRLRASAATFVQATPTTWRMLVDAGWSGDPRLKIVCGGEAFPRGLANELVRLGASLWHMYGPTETTVWSAIRALEEGEGPPPIGGPIANTRFYVLDAHLQPVPAGVPGQLHIGGDGVARGYRNRSELTAEKFIEDPFRRSERIYATGDLVRYRPGGTLEFLGRLDHQVKLRGFRVELGEIEAVLTQYPAVRSAVVVVREDTLGDRRLVAYYVQEPGASAGAGELRRHLGAQLPGYMVPSTFVCLEELPTNANRKVDRSALPAPESARPQVEQPYVAPRTPIEEMVVDTWCEVLGLERIGVEDDFFELGGNSLLATQVVARLARRLGVAVPLRAIFELPTPAELAASLVGLLALVALDDEDGLRLVAELEQLDAVGGGR